VSWVVARVLLEWCLSVLGSCYGMANGVRICQGVRWSLCSVLQGIFRHLLWVFCLFFGEVGIIVLLDSC